MEKYRKMKIITMVALIVTIFGITIGFSAYTQVLTISSTASISPDSSTFSVKFSTQQDKLNESEVVASSVSEGVETTNGIINNTVSPTISNLSATFTTPGQYAEYTFYARNEGEYKAYLNNINFIGAKSCTGGSGATESLVQSACNSISMTVTVAETTYSQTTEILGHALEKNTGEKIVVKLNYDTNGSRADGEFVVNFEQVTMVYSSVDDSSFVPPTTSPSNPTENEDTINYQMKRLAQSDASVDFNTTPVAGVYVRSGTENNTNPIYYYRGAVANNNVLFANKCWKVVRTTETGGIKLIYNGTPTSGQCNGTSPTVGTSAFNTNYSTAADVRYIYEDGTDSAIKGVVDSWYAANMTSYTSYLEDTPWCSDRTELDPASLGVTDLPEGSILYGAYERMVAGTPSVSCSSEYQMSTTASTVANRLKYPTALLTADEIMLAGTGIYGTEGYDVKAYLNIGENWWALSPLGFSGDGFAGGFVVYSDGSLYGGDVDSEDGVRPAVSLAPGTEFTSGDGTSGTPYIIG